MMKKLYYYSCKFFHKVKRRCVRIYPQHSKYLYQNSFLDRIFCLFDHTIKN